MKKIAILALILSIIFLVLSCTNLDKYIPIEKYNSEILELENRLEEANSETESKSLEILELKEEVNTLKNDLELSNEGIVKYQNLIANLNEYLKNIYYVYQKKSDGSSSWGTGFSINHKGKIYLITVGHAIENKYGVFKNLGFKSNLNNEFIYPELLVYSNDYDNDNDYAIFYSDKVKNGLIVDNEGDKPEYILGNNKSSINIIRSFNINGIEGESGSAIVDNEGEIIGIVTTDLYYKYTPMNLIMEAIDNLK